MIPIERNVQMPADINHRRTRRWLPFKNMQPGDSILVTEPPISLPQTIKRWQERLGVQFASAKEPGGAVRVWRLPEPAAVASSVASMPAPAEPSRAPAAASSVASEPRLPRIRCRPVAPAPVATAPVQARPQRLTCNPERVSR